MHPTVNFRHFSDHERRTLWPGNIHDADACEKVLRLAVARYSIVAQLSIMRRRLRANAAVAITALSDVLDAGVREL